MSPPSCSTSCSRRLRFSGGMTEGLFDDIQYYHLNKARPSM
jgi:hypothetical protein